MADTDENTTLPSQLINTISTIPGVSVFISDRPRNVSLKRWKMRSDTRTESRTPVGGE